MTRRFVLGLLPGAAMAQIALPQYRGVLAGQSASAYYVDSVGGNDANDGLTSGTPFRTLDKLSAALLGYGYYVDLTEGSDALAGTSPATAWLTKGRSGSLWYNHTVGLRNGSTWSGTGPGSIVLFGDSLIYKCGPFSTGAYSSYNDAGFWGWAEVLEAQRFNMISNAGVNGNTTSQMLARLATDVLALHPQWVLVHGGVNDMGPGADTSILANLTAICDAIRASGAKVILCTVPPNSTFTGGTTITAYQATNTGIAAYAAAHPSDVILADTGASNRTSWANPVPVGGTTYDVVHPNRWGAQRMGQTLVAAILAASGIPDAYPLITVVGGGNLLANPLMTGTGGGTSGTASGSIADNWTAIGSSGGTAVCSKVARVDGIPGSWQQIAYTGTSNSSAVLLQSAVGSGFSAGDQVYAMVEWQSDNNWTAPFKTYAYLSANDSTQAYSLFWPDDDSVAEQVNIGGGVFRTLPFTVPGGTTYLALYLVFNGGNGTGTIRFGRCEVKKAL